VVTFPDFGVTENMVSQDYINTDVSEFRKGFRAASNSEIVVGFDATDAGQVALRAAAAARSNYAFRLVSADSPNVATTTNTTRYSRGVVGGPNFAGGGGEEFDNETYTLALNQAPIVVPQEAI
jgi:hypothetical protein